MKGPAFFLVLLWVSMASARSNGLMKDCPRFNRHYSDCTSVEGSSSELFSSVKIRRRGRAIIAVAETPEGQYRTKYVPNSVVKSRTKELESGEILSFNESSYCENGTLISTKLPNAPDDTSSTEESEITVEDGVLSFTLYSEGELQLRVHCTEDSEQLLPNRTRTRRGSKSKRSRGSKMRTSDEDEEDDGTEDAGESAVRSKPSRGSRSNRTKPDDDGDEQERESNRTKHRGRGFRSKREDKPEDDEDGEERRLKRSRGPRSNRTRVPGEGEERESNRTKHRGRRSRSNRTKLEDGAEQERDSNRTKHRGRGSRLKRDELPEDDEDGEERRLKRTRGPRSNRTGIPEDGEERESNRTKHRGRGSKPKRDKTLEDDGEGEERRLKEIGGTGPCSNSTGSPEDGAKRGSKSSGPNTSEDEERDVKRSSPGNRASNRTKGSKADPIRMI